MSFLCTWLSQKVIHMNVRQPAIFANVATLHWNVWRVLCRRQRGPHHTLISINSWIVSNFPISLKHCILRRCVEFQPRHLALVEVYEDSQRFEEIQQGWTHSHHLRCKVNSSMVCWIGKRNTISRISICLLGYHITICWGRPKLKQSRNSEPSGSSGWPKAVKVWAHPSAHP